MMKRWEYLLAGAVGAGKTSLIMALRGQRGPAPKTQSLVFHDRLIDLPGEYLAYPYLRKQFLSTAARAKGILFLLGADALPSMLPPGLLTQPGLPVTGIVSKCDLPDADPEYAERELMRLGLRPPFYRISVRSPETLEPIHALLGAPDNGNRPPEAARRLREERARPCPA
jgi:Ethanolamine utilization protein